MPRWGTACTDEAEAVLRGEFRLFSHRDVAAGFPPDWHRNQLTEDGGQRAEVGEQTANSEGQTTGNSISSPVLRPPTSDFRLPTSALSSQPSALGSQLSQSHWTEISDFNQGDIKGVWELSRFSWAFALGRAFSHTNDQRYSAAFWQLFDDWCRGNPPNVGPNWMCGQEATFRLMAVVFAAEAVGVPAERRDAVARFAVATGRRIAANLDYALSQKNNHGVSECVGLITAGLVVPDYAESAGWIARGLRELECQLRELVYEDGAFAQHSLIYHRVLLHDLCWCRNRLTLAAQAIPAWLDAAGRRALDFLMALVDPTTGLAPLYGSNDGANVLPLADADFLDLRPTIQAAAAIFRSELLRPEGPWDEAAFWLAPDQFGKVGAMLSSEGQRACARTASPPHRLTVPPPHLPVRWHARQGGCFQVTNGRSRLFLRCPEKFRHRPCQADMLHVDVWHDGQPIAHDGGTFSYNSMERFTALSSASGHNVITVDGREPLKKIGRFLYLPWPKGTVSDQDPEFSACHNGYAELGVRWTRSVLSKPEGVFEVKDSVQSRTPHRYRLHWRLCDRNWQLSADGSGISAVGQCACARSENESTIKQPTSVHLDPQLQENLRGRRSGEDSDSTNNSAYSIRWQCDVSPQSVRLIRTDATSAEGWWSPYYGAVEPAVSLVLEFECSGPASITTRFVPPGDTG